MLRDALLQELEAEERTGWNDLSTIWRPAIVYGPDHGRRDLLVSALASAAATIVGLFAEPLPAGPLGRLRVASFAAVVAGAVALAPRQAAANGDGGGAASPPPEPPGAPKDGPPTSDSAGTRSRETGICIAKRRELSMARIVICGVDDSAGARKAARVAAPLAEAFDGELLLVHIAQVPVVPGASGVPGGREELFAFTREDAERLLERIAVDAGVETAPRRVGFGAASEVLTRIAREENAELLVVGCRGQGHLRAALLGSVSAGLCRSAPCPVVVVPPAPAPRPVDEQARAGRA